MAVESLMLHAIAVANWDISKGIIRREDKATPALFHLQGASLTEGVKMPRDEATIPNILTGLMSPRAVLPGSDMVDHLQTEALRSPDH